MTCECLDRGGEIGRGYGVLWISHLVLLLHLGAAATNIVYSSNTTESTVRDCLDYMFHKIVCAYSHFYNFTVNATSVRLCNMLIRECVCKARKKNPSRIVVLRQDNCEVDARVEGIPFFTKFQFYAVVDFPTA